jgi:hypothetical protein
MKTQRFFTLQLPATPKVRELLTVLFHVNEDSKSDIVLGLLERLNDEWSIARRTLRWQVLSGKQKPTKALAGKIETLCHVLKHSPQALGLDENTWRTLKHED